MEIPMLIEVPVETESPSRAPVPQWSGAPHTVGVVGGSADWILGSDSVFQRFHVPEALLRHGSLTVTLGVAHDEFVDPTAWPRPDLLAVASNLHPEVFDTSFFAIHQRYDPADTGKHPPVSIQPLRRECSYSQICRIVVTFGPTPGLLLPKADEWLQVTLKPGSLRSGRGPVGRAGFVVVIEDDQHYDLLQERLADAAELAVFVTVLCGSSAHAAFTTSRMLLFLRIKCGREPAVLDHALNLWELGIGDGPNRLYIGGIVASIASCGIPMFVHFLMVVIQGALGRRPQGDASHPAAAQALEQGGRACGGRLNMNEFRALQATVRFPHFTLVIALFMYQGVATSAFRLLFHGQSAGEAVLGAAALIFFCGGLSLVSWWKIARAGVAKTEAEYVNLGGASATVRYLLGDGEWVSTTRRRLVHTYGVLFEAYRERWVHFALVEQAVLLPLAALGALSAPTFGRCIAHGVVTCLVLTLFLLGIVIMRPWASPFDNHLTWAVTGLMLLSGVIATASFGRGDLDNVAADVAAWLMIFSTGFIVLKSAMDCCFLVYDTYVARRWRLQEVFEQGQTLFRGHDTYRLASDAQGADGGDEGPLGMSERSGRGGDNDREEAMLALLAPAAVSAYLHHLMPAGKVRDGAASAEQADAPADGVPVSPALPHLRDPFAHKQSCAVRQGLLALCTSSRRLRACPVCQAQRRGGGGAAEEDWDGGGAPSEVGGAGAAGPCATSGRELPQAAEPAAAAPAAGRSQGQRQWMEFFADDGSPYYYCAATGETTWDPPGGGDGDSADDGAGRREI